MINCLILRLNYTNITRDRVCLVYAPMTSIELNIAASVPKKSFDYITPLFHVPTDVTKTKGPNTDYGHTLTTAERNRR
ncbi:hypothetical protein H5410_016147 [Solanum commersonii]|uniref:Uncharacterized protein n=1 Tax=Solanum commersonii TaxID=4109 RepID=A0A9J5ZW73_SOLCO|nr:hypothetical protein H5410_016147 [Solanum commersonii]